MRGTPRIFVGTVTLCVDGLRVHRVAQAVRGEVARLPGVRVLALDAAAGSVSVTAHLPVDRGDVVAALERAGCRVR